MKSIKNFIILITLSLLPLHISAKEKEKSETHFLSGFIIGKYQIIGKELNSNKTYMGEFEIKEKQGELVFIKKINDETIQGKAKVEKSMEGTTKILRLNYLHLKQAFEQTCLFNSDLDNYARISCHLYEKDISTKNPGLEAMFIKHED